jgi:hypothetical protein
MDPRHVFSLFPHLGLAFERRRPRQQVLHTCDRFDRKLPMNRIYRAPLGRGSARVLPGRSSAACDRVGPEQDAHLESAIIAPHPLPLPPSCFLGLRPALGDLGELALDHSILLVAGDDDR